MSRDHGADSLAFQVCVACWGRDRATQTLGNGCCLGPKGCREAGHALSNVFLPMLMALVLG